MALPNISDYHVPSNTDDAIALLQKYGETAMLVAGGTFVHGLEVRGVLADIEALIDIGRLGLAGIERSGDGLRLGATTIFAELEAHEAVTSDPAFGAIADALTYPPAQIKNVGTVGGCLAASAPLYDLPAALLALEGVAEAIGAGGTREIPLDDFFTGLFENALQSDELITSILLPAASASTASAFLKLETNANDLAILNVAVRITRDGGNCVDARIVVGGGVGESYVRASGAEAALNGAPATPDSFAAAAAAVANDIDPVDDHRGSADYRRHIAKIYTRRALERALARLG
ncbi:MAG: FAD binding domain-containing protein [Gammaproteobacteria bacterium]